MAEEITSTTTTAYHYHYDGNGNVTEVTDSSGNPAATYRYDAFGNTLVAIGTYATTNKYRFSTKPIDEEITNTPLYYYGYRYYDATTGRWPSRDPISDICFIIDKFGNDKIKRIDLLKNLLQKKPSFILSLSDKELLRIDSESNKNSYGFIENNSLNIFDKNGLIAFTTGHYFFSCPTFPRGRFCPSLWGCSGKPGNTKLLPHDPVSFGKCILVTEAGMAVACAKNDSVEFYGQCDNIQLCYNLFW